MPNEITRLLKDYQSGKKAALDELLPIVYDELRRVAHRLLSNEYAETLPTTALVHEAYIKLIDQHSVDWQNRGQFFAISAQAMRRILVDNSRSRHRQKRDGIKINLDDAYNISSKMDESILDLDLALDELAKLDEQQAKIVEMHYFAGLTFDEISQILNLSPAAVYREWKLAKAWLYRKIYGI